MMQLRKISFTFSLLLFIFAFAYLIGVSHEKLSENKVKCLNNLKNISIASSFYIEDKGDFPLNPYVLYEEEYIVHSEPLYCPSKKQPGVSGKYITEDLSFPQEFPSTQKFIYDDAGNHWYSINVLFADGHVETITGE